MEPIELASIVMTALLPYLAKGGEEATKSVGKAGAEKGMAFLSSLRKRWATDSEAAGALMKLEQDPDSYRTVLENMLVEKIHLDPELHDELLGVLNPTTAALSIVQEGISAEGVIGVKSDQIHASPLETNENSSPRSTAVRTSCSRSGRMNGSPPVNLTLRRPVSERRCKILRHSSVESSSKLAVRCKGGAD